MLRSRPVRLLPSTMVAFSCCSLLCEPLISLECHRSGGLVGAVEATVMS